MSKTDSTPVPPADKSTKPNKEVSRQEALLGKGGRPRRCLAKVPGRERCPPRGKEATRGRRGLQSQDALQQLPGREGGAGRLGGPPPPFVAELQREVRPRTLEV